MSNNEDVDMTEIIMKLKTQEMIYQSSLNAGAKIIKPTLMDFIG